MNTSWFGRAVLLSTRFLGLNVRWVAGDLVGVCSVTDARYKVLELPSFRVLRTFYGGRGVPFRAVRPAEPVWGGSRR